jgi:hypothetical protein
MLPKYTQQKTATKRNIFVNGIGLLALTDVYFV